MSAIMMMLLAGGGSSRVSSNITISANTANYVLNTAKVTGYVAGSTDVTLTINSGVVVYSGSTGSYAFQVDSSWAAGDTVTIVNNGTILGRGGNGGNGSNNQIGNYLYLNTGGGGGSYKTGQATGNGGNGGFGGGGGGGAASDNGFASGAGGKGGDGLCIVISEG